MRKHNSKNYTLNESESQKVYFYRIYPRGSKKIRIGGSEKLITVV